MAGISPISAISFIYSTASANDKLTETTKAKLRALGISTEGILTESQGQAILMQAMATGNSGETLSSSNNKSQDDEATKLAKLLAYDLDLNVTDNDTLDDIIIRIRSKISELKHDANNNKDKLSAVQDYSDRLNVIETLQLSQINLQTTQDLLAANNRSYFGL